MIRRSYSRIAMKPVRMESRVAILASSVNNKSTVSSVGQEVGTEETFTEESYLNTTWETGPGE